MAGVLRRLAVPADEPGAEREIDETVRRMRAEGADVHLVYEDGYYRVAPRGQDIKFGSKRVS